MHGKHVYNIEEQKPIDQIWLKTTQKSNILIFFYSKLLMKNAWNM